DQRLTLWADGLGLVGHERRERHRRWMTELAAGRDVLQRVTVSPAEARSAGLPGWADGGRRSLYAVLALPDVTFAALLPAAPESAALSPNSP
ncbi:hypothetical protein J8J27_26765, partial [Mycobacterium tuberculosis]|nr:hypothetical protein [Mycobacterium tuberculosis]